MIDKNNARLLEIAEMSIGTFELNKEAANLLAANCKLRQKCAALTGHTFDENGFCIYCGEEKI